MAVFSDIHGNLFALQAMLKALEFTSIDGYIFCGDISGYFYQPLEVAKTLLSLSPLYAVLGNHDAYYLESYRDPEKTEMLCARYGNSYRKKTPELRDILLSLPMTLDLSLDGHSVYVAHGSFTSPLEGRIYPDTDLPVFDGYADTSFLGHTHYHMLRRIGKYAVLCNPGSLGQPRGREAFSYVIWDTRLDVFTFHSISLSIENLIHEVRSEDPDNDYLLQTLEKRRIASV